MNASPPRQAPADAGPLLRALAELSQVPPTVAWSAAEAVLGSPLRGAPLPEGGSHLNWNGFPLQLLLSLRQDRVSIRLLGDPLRHLTDPIARYEAAGRATRTTLAYANAPAMRAAAGKTLELMMPAATPAVGHPGSLFLGVAVGAPGAAMYLSPAALAARCEKAREWAARVSPAPAAAARLLARVETGCFLIGFGIEGALSGSLRMKLYWRSATHVSLDDFGVPLFLDSDVAGFVDRMLAEGAPFEALNFSAAFDLVTGALRDVKVDVSWNERTLAQGLTLLDTLSPALGVRLRQGDLIGRHDLGIACIGVGVDSEGRRRVNTYLFEP